jgi:hypothetical protein
MAPQNTEIKHDSPSKSLDLIEISRHKISISTTSASDKENDAIRAIAYCNQCSNQVWSGVNRWDHIIDDFYTPTVFSVAKSSVSYRITGLKPGEQQRKISAAMTALDEW